MDPSWLMDEYPAVFFFFSLLVSPKLHLSKCLKTGRRWYISFRVHTCHACGNTTRLLERRVRRRSREWSSGVIQLQVCCRTAGGWLKGWWKFDFFRQQKIGGKDRFVGKIFRSYTSCCFFFGSEILTFCCFKSLWVSKKKRQKNDAKSTDQRKQPGCSGHHLSLFWECIISRAPKTMKNNGFSHLKTRWFTIKTSKNVGFGGPPGSFKSLEIGDLLRPDFPRATHLDTSPWWRTGEVGEIWQVESVGRGWSECMNGRR